MNLFLLCNLSPLSNFSCSCCSSDRVYASLSIKIKPSSVDLPDRKRPLCPFVRTCDSYPCTFEDGVNVRLPVRANSRLCFYPIWISSRYIDTLQRDHLLKGFVKDSRCLPWTYSISNADATDQIKRLRSQFTASRPTGYRYDTSYVFTNGDKRHP
jgi:hypothetical protein